MTDRIKWPNFFLVGVVKGGTTSLHHYLDQHPQIYMSPVKETNFFSAHAIDPAKFSRAYAHDVDVDLPRYFREGMPRKIHIAHVTDEREYLQLFAPAGDVPVRGEASASYLIYPGTAGRIFQKCPDARILMMLRDPAERAFSQYLMNLRLGKTLEKDFLSEVQADASRAVKGWGASHQYLEIGRYAGQVKQYLDVFPPDRVMICWYDEYRKDAAAVLRSVCRFLEVDEDFEPDTSEKLNTAGVPRFAKLNYWFNQSGMISWAKRRLPDAWRGPFKKWMYSSDRSEVPAMSTDERAWLVNYYKEDIRELEMLTGRDLQAWKG